MARTEAHAPRPRPRKEIAASSTQIPAISTEPSRRVISLDAFRAAAIALMIFMDHHTYPQGVPTFLRHPGWNGFRLPDYVFPAFIFIAGVSLAYSTRKRGADLGRTSFTFGRRVGLLFVLGLVLNFFKYGLPLRIMGVLQRIAMSLAIAWPFTRLRARWAIVAAIVLLVGYSVVFLYVGAPDVPAGSLEKVPSISGYIDTTVFGLEHTYKQSGFDPEGLLGTLTAAALALIGLAVGKLLVAAPDDRRQLAIMGLIGIVLIGAAVLLHPLIPVNKKLWTSTFTLISAGVSLVLLPAMYWVVDLKGHTKLVEWLVPLGRNALFIYIASNLLVVAGRTWIHVTVAGQSVSLWSAVGTKLAQYVGLGGASLLISAAEVALWLGVAAVLHKRKIYIKL